MTYIKSKYPTILSVILCSCLIAYALGCEPKTRSLIEPTQTVNLEELQMEVDILLLQSEVRLADLKKQYELRDMIFNQSIKIAQTGNINPTGLITTLMAVLGIGTSADNIRLRRKIKIDHKDQTVSEA